MAGIDRSCRDELLRSRASQLSFRAIHQPVMALEGIVPSRVAAEAEEDPPGPLVCPWKATIMSDTPVSRRSKVLFWFLLVIGLPLGALVALEGLSSLALWVSKPPGSPRQEPPPEEISVQFDAEIGWVGIKSLVAPNRYGPGVALHTNSRGFRGTEEIGDAVPAGMRRLVCSGDSFTLGYGVGDEDTWCALLATPALQTVNMGQGAYGIDQAYLWYRRDGRALAHDVQLLAFITVDFERMERDKHRNRAKPRLAVRGDSLVVLGVPIPRKPRKSLLTERLLAWVQSLHTVRLVAALTNRADREGPGRRNGTTGPRKLSAELSTVIAKIVADLAKMNAAKGSTLVLVYLPVQADFRNGVSDAPRQRMHVIADSLHVPLIDLIPAQRQLGPQEAPQLHIQATDGLVAEAAGHYSVKGNRWVAEQIRGVLDSLLRGTERRPRS